MARSTANVSPLERWHSNDAVDAIERLFAGGGAPPGHTPTVTVQQATVSRTVQSDIPSIDGTADTNSSRHLSATSTRPPSLTTSQSTLHSFSLRTIGTGASLGAELPEVAEDNDESSADERTEAHLHTFQCIFHFLLCPFSTDDQAAWARHLNIHFDGKAVPRAATCPFCPSEESSGGTTWAAYVDHIAMHLKRGWRVEEGRPDRDLFIHLFNIRVVTNAEYQELMTAKRLSSKPESYMQISGERQERRRGGNRAGARDRRRP